MRDFARFYWSMAMLAIFLFPFVFLPPSFPPCLEKLALTG